MILALDTSTPITELFLADSGGKILKQIKAETGNQLSEQLLQIIEDALKDADLKLNVSRLARGIPVGLDLEYADIITLKHALEGYPCRWRSYGPRLADQRFGEA